MALHESAEMYLETIYTLTKARGSVRSIDVAEDMGYSKPSVSRAVGLLKKIAPTPRQYPRRYAKIKQDPL